MNITIKTIPHDQQRYDTPGDWVLDGDNLDIFISDMNNWKYEFLVAIHELVEVVLCKDRGIKQEDVDSFDIEFEKNRPEGNTDEPGHDPKAPYHDEHVFAEKIEKMLARELGINWKKYDNKVVSL